MKYASKSTVEELNKLAEVDMPCSVFVNVLVSSPNLPFILTGLSLLSSLHAGRT